jgi:hypothetical protein
MQWIFDPPYHGKGPCDGKSSLLKHSAAMYLLKGQRNNNWQTLYSCLLDNNHIDSSEQLATFISTHDNTFGKLVSIKFQSKFSQESMLHLHLKMKK